MNSRRPRAVVLLSSGLDSTVNLYEALDRGFEVALAITFNYGQRAALREVERATRIAARAGVPHKIIELPWFGEFTSTALVQHKAKVPTRNDVAIDDMSTSKKTAKAVWVPNRNGILLNIAAGFAEGLNADAIVPGFNIEEGATFPDNTEEYLQALTSSFSYSTANGVKAVCFTTSLNKTEIVRRGRTLGAPFDLMWPCYFAENEVCGECESCQRFRRAMKEA